ncbi:carboxypeptidase regulatory-like domain-containing protein [bacterium]|nr:carboxypeptidase regulatory-like domain-containing protein [bacterium]
MRGRLPLILAILLCSTSLALAQNTRMMLEISPSHTPAGPLTVKPGEQIQFTAKAYEFTAAGRQEVQIGQLSWSLDPQAFGSIDGNGLLTAAAQNGAPRGVVTATATVNNVTLTADVAIVLGLGASTHTFSGNVSDVNGPIQDAEVSVMSVGMLPFLVTGKTDAHGDYSVDVPAGSYIVYAEAYGYIPEYHDDALTRDKATTYVTDPNVTTIDDIDFVLSTGGSISGTVYDAATNAPIEGAIVFAGPDGNRIPPNGSTAGFHARTDAQGHYEIKGLVDDDYIVMAMEQNYVQQYYDGETDPANADPVTIANAGTASGIDFGLNERQPDPVYTISGTVYDNNSNPIEGATIFAEMQSGPMLRWLSARSAVDGSYSIDVPAGTFIVHAMMQGLVTEYYDNVADASQATSLTLDANNTAETGIDFTLGEGGVITGTVKDANGNPIEGAAMSAFGDPNHRTPSGSNAGAFSRTDANGEYRITGLATGDWYVQAVKDGYVMEYYDDETDLTLATKVSVIDGQTTSGINFGLDMLPGIDGTVTDAATGAPIEHALIVLDGPNSRAFAYTDANGNYHLATHPGTFMVHCSATGYGAEWYDDVTDIAQATAVTVTQSGSVTGIDFALDKFGGSITGVVKDAAGNGIQDAIVRAWSNVRITPAGNVPHNFGTARTAADGSYVIDGLPPADYIVRAEAQHYLPEYYDDAADMSNATSVTVSNQTVSGIDFALDAGGSISGTITDEDTGDPLPHAVVFVRGSNMRFERAARTDANGDYTIEGLRSDSYIVFAAGPGHLGEFYDDATSPSTATPVTVSAPSAVTGIDMALATSPVGPRIFRGYVFARGNSSVPQYVLVEAINPVNGMRLTTTTNIQGHFEFQAWENAIIRTRAIGYVGQYAGGTMNWKESRWEGATGSMTFMLDPVSETGMAEVSGVVTDASTGNALADAWIYGMDAEGNVFFTVTGGDGSYLMQNTTNGSLDVMVSEVLFDNSGQQTTVDDASGKANIAAQRSSVTAVDDSPSLPATVRLYQNYPNPFNPSTTLRFDLPERTDVTLRVYNLLGREIATLAEGMHDAGSYSVNFDATGLPSGLYFARLKSGEVLQTRRMTLMK